MGSISERCSECLSREKTFVLYTFKTETINDKITHNKPLKFLSNSSQMMQYFYSTNSNKTKATSALKKLNKKKIWHQIYKSDSSSPLVDLISECPKDLKEINTKIILREPQNLNLTQIKYKTNKKFFITNEKSSSKSDKNIFSKNLNFGNFNEDSSYMKNSALKTNNTKFSKKYNNKEKILIEFDSDEESKLLKETLKFPKYLKQNFESEHFVSNLSCKKRKNKFKDNFIYNNQNCLSIEKKHYILSSNQIKTFGKKWNINKFERIYPKDDVIKIEDIDGEEALKIKKYYYRKKKASESRRKKVYNNSNNIIQ